MKMVGIVCLLAAVACQVMRDRLYAREAPETQPLMYVRSPEVIKRIALGFDSLAADVYWIRALQHYGRQRLAASGGPQDYSLLYPLLDLTTSLDPHFRIAYRFGAIFLSERFPGGPGRPDLAIALLQKGIAADPDRWEYFHDIGFVHYWTLRDPTTAAQWFTRASERPNAPNWLAPIAAAMLTQGADRASARYLWRQILAADEEWLRTRAQVALAQLDALDQIDILTSLVNATPPPGGSPYSWAVLIRAGKLAGIPADPSGTPYLLDPVSGEIRVSQGSPLFPMPPSGPPK
jgi:hypothetical protein